MTANVILYEHYKSKGGLYPIVIRLINGKKQKLIPTGYKIKVSQWVKNAVVKHPDQKVINAKIADLLSVASGYISTHKTYDLENVFREAAGNSFVGYLNHRAKQYKEQGQHSYYRQIHRLSEEFEKAVGGISFEEITEDDLRKLKIYLSAKHQNTVRWKFTKLRQFFKKAIEEGKANYPNPFAGFKINKVPVKKKKLTVEEIRALEKVILYEEVSTARDMFLFSYYAKGVRFENCVAVKKSDISEGRIHFRTNKGKKYLSVLIHPRLKALIRKYPGSPFLFPYLKKDLPIQEEGRRKILDSINSQVNQFLKIAAAAAGIRKPVSFHFARHSFAQHLNNKSKNRNAVKDALGHSSIRVTEEYLESLDDELLDSEMKKVYGD